MRLIKYLPEFLELRLSMSLQTLRIFKINELAKESLFRLQSKPDNIPMPNPILVFQVVGHESQRDFYFAGKIVIEDIAA